MNNLLNKLPDLRRLVRTPAPTKNVVLGAVVTAALVMFTLVVTLAPEPDKKAVEETIWPVTTMMATPAMMSPELNLFGRVETPRQSALTAAVVAHVLDVRVREGEAVMAGDVLIQLDATDAALEVDRCKADLAEATANLASVKLKAAEDESTLVKEQSLFDLAAAKVERYERLRSQKSIAEEIINAVHGEADRQAIALYRQRGIVADAANALTRSTARVTRANALLGEAQANLARTSIRAPFDGRIASVEVSPGEWVQPGSKVLSIYDTRNIEVRAQIPAQYLEAVKASLADGVSLPAQIETGGQMLPAQLVRLSGEVATGRSSVDGLFSLDDRSLEVGRAVHLKLALPAVADTVAVPIQSLYGDHRIFVVAEGRLKAIDVQRLGDVTDRSGQLRVLVRSTQINATVPIVTSQLGAAIDGLKVITGKPDRKDPTPALLETEKAVAQVVK